MKSQLKLVLLMGVLALGTLPAVGCGGAECGEGTTDKDGTCVANETGDNPDVVDDGVTCGEGTVEESGVCVPSGENVACGPKTVLDENGVCVVSPEACEDGETLDPNSGNCVAGTAECGVGTALDGATGTCVPTAEVCDTGTVFDDESGLCLPGVSCGTGDVIVDGVCANPAEELASNADVTDAENNDPSFGGTAQALEVKGAGAQTVFTGTIGTPVDLDADGEVDQDVDVFSFEAVEGDWFEISVQSLGLPSPVFAITGPNDFLRLSSFLSGPAAARQVVVPADGTYTVAVLPLSAVYSPFPAGADDWNYVGSLKQIDTPTPADLDFSADVLAGDFGSLSDNFYKITGYAAGDLVTVTVDSADDGAEGVLSSWNSATEFSGSTEIAAGDSFSVIIPASGELFVVVDWESLAASGAGFELSSTLAENFQNVGILGDDSVTSSTPVALEDAALYSYIFSVSAGQVIELTSSNDEDESVFISLQDASGTTLISRTSTSVNYWYTETGGTFVAVVDNSYWSADALTNSVLNIRTLTPNDLGAVGIGDTITEAIAEPLEEDTSDFHILTLNENVAVSGDITSLNDEDIDVSFLASDNREIYRTATVGSEEFDTVLVPAGTVLIQVDAYEATPSYEINLTFAEAPEIEVEPNDTIGEATPYNADGEIRGTMTTSGEIDFYSFELTADLAADEVFIIEMARINTNSIEVACFLTDSLGNDVGTIQPAGTGNGCIAMSDSLVAGETYYLELRRIYYSGSVDYNITTRIETGVLESEPNEDETSATAIDLDALLTGTDIFGSMATNSDVDVFSFELATDQAGDELIAFSSENFGSNPTTGKLSLLDASSGVVASANIGTGLRVGGLTAGTYYLELTRTGSTSYWTDVVYQISAVDVAVVCGDGVVEGDEICDGQAECTDLCEWEAGYVPPLINDDAITFTQGMTPLLRTISSTQCDSIASVTVDVDFGTAETWRDETRLVLIGPSGTSVRLHDEDMGPTSRSFVGNFPDDFTVHGPGSLDDFIGESGVGIWTLEITYFYTGNPQYNSFGLNLTCD